jgi:hypothetical protein
MSIQRQFAKLQRKILRRNYGFFPTMIFSFISFGLSVDLTKLAKWDTFLMSIGNSISWKREAKNLGITIFISTIILLLILEFYYQKDVLSLIIGFIYELKRIY